MHAQSIRIRILEALVISSEKERRENVLQSTMEKVGSVAVWGRADR